MDASVLEALHGIGAAAGHAVLEVYRAGPVAVGPRAPGDPVTALSCGCAA